jgi:MFS family permease
VSRGPRAAPHPFLWGILYLPYGATSGYVTVALAFVAKERGLSDGAIAGLIGAFILPQTWKFLWAPVADSTFTRRGWYVAANLTSSAILVAVGLAPLASGITGGLEVLISLASLATTFLAMSTEALLANTIPPDQRGKASGWLQAGTIGGGGIGGGFALAVASRFGLAPASLALAALLACCSLALLRIPEPVREGGPGGARAAMARVGRDVWSSILASRTGLLALVLCFVPVGAAAASNLFAAIADRWSAPADAVAIVTGVLGGIVSAVGCLAGGWLSDRMDRKGAYAVAGLGLAAVAVGMWAAPRSLAAFAVFTLAYQFVAGVAWSTFTGFVLEAIGKGAVSTKYATLASLSNVPIYYMTRLNGWASDRWGAGVMLLVDAASEVVGVAIFLFMAYLLVGRSRKPAAAPAEG